MGFWKILGGIAAGVGAVALLPVAGAVGAVTMTGAIVGGTVGAAVAAGTEDEKKKLREENQRMAATNVAVAQNAERMVSDANQKVSKANEKAAVAEQRANAAEAMAADLKEKIEKTAKILDRYRESLKDVEAHYQLVIALTAIGMAAASADGSIDACETGELDEYISGVASAKLPAKVKARILYLHNHPPTFEEAFAEVGKLNKEGLPLDAFRQLIVGVIEADGKIEEGEKIFLKKWDDMVVDGKIKVFAVKEERHATTKSCETPRTNNVAPAKSASQDIEGKAKKPVAKKPDAVAKKTTSKKNAVKVQKPVAKKTAASGKKSVSRKPVAAAKKTVARKGVPSKKAKVKVVARTKTVAKKGKAKK